MFAPQRDTSEPQTFSEMCASRADELDLGRREIAAALGVSTNQVANYLSGHTLVPLERLQALVEILRLRWPAAFIAWFRDAASDELFADFESLLDHRNAVPTDVSAQTLRSMLETTAGAALDVPTKRLVQSMLSAIIDWRDSITIARGDHRDFRVIDPDHQVIQPALSGDAGVRHRPIGANRERFGYYFGVIEFDPGSFGYHRHTVDDLAAGGMEFAFVVRGRGLLLVEDHARRKRPDRDRPWVRRVIKAGTAASFRGDRGHCFLNTAARGPLRVVIAATPYPPETTPEEPDVFDTRYRGAANATVGTLHGLDEADIPASLRDAILKAIE